MNVRQIETFLWAARLGSFHAAARHLRVTQPVVSARMREIERLLGVALFERSGRRVHLTPRGRDLVPYAARFLDLHAEIQNRVANASRLAGRVRFAITSRPAMTWLPALMRRLERQYPLIEAEFVITNSEDMSAQLRQGELDFALMAGPVAAANIRSETVMVARMGWLASPRLSLPQHPLSPRELAGFPVITDTRGSRLFQLAMDWFRSEEAEPRRHHGCSSLVARTHLAVEGLGVALIPLASAAADLAAGRLRVVHTATPLRDLDYVIAYTDAGLTQAVRVVVEEAKALIAGTPPPEGG
ncbi:MAG: LysR family transcriptional regulator [Rhodobacteraceae bacterium]|nr:LysR family transcriptional regulator [Paracoccaceae bacterium]